MKFFTRKTDVPIPYPVEIVLPIPTGLRVGMWVKTLAGAVGILTDILPDSTVVVSYTKADGTNVMALDDNDKSVPKQEAIHIAQVTQALISDIPASRYESTEQLKALGYGDK